MGFLLEGVSLSLFHIPPFFVPSHLASLVPLPLLSLLASTVHDEQIWLASRSQEIHGQKALEKVFPHFLCI
ncbi:hypothetical protein SLE2022_062720 [Rubroshorea leprosula]